MAAYWRARESARENPIIHDAEAVRIVGDLLPPLKRDKFDRSPLLQMFVDLVAVRTRLIDEHLLRWLEEEPSKVQVVDLGAGLDSRPYRLSLSENVDFYYVDTGAVNSLRDTIYQKSGTHARLIRVDANLGRIGQVRELLKAAGLDFKRRVFWTLEGLIEFLGPKKTDALLRTIRGCSPSGSAVAVSVLDPEIIQVAERAGDHNFPWKRLPSVEEVISALAGWDVSVISGDEAGRRFGRPLHNCLQLVTAHAGRNPISS